LELHVVGELDVELIEAKNVKNTDVIGKTDPFVVLYVRQTKDKTKRSKSKQNTLKPVWNERFTLEVCFRFLFVKNLMLWGILWKKLPTL
jgi:Ca2+-dependent lipid-binding protein